MIESIDTSWMKVLEPEIKSHYFKNLVEFLYNEKTLYDIFPPEKEIFSWTQLTKFQNVKVVIIGQDPYHSIGQAHGLAFSVPQSCKPPSSLVNIYKELQSDIENFNIPGHGNLSNWAKQGVLLLNSVLTVRSGTPNSHKDKGWENLTDAVMKALNKKDNIVFLLWGNYAQKKGAFLNNENNLIIKCPHPSPHSASYGFFGSKCFSRANEFLKSKNKAEIRWNDL